MIWTITYRQGLLLLSYIALTYVVIYYVMPRCIVKNKKLISSIGILALLFTLFLVLNYWFTYLTSLDTVNVKVRQGIPDAMPALNVLIKRSISPVIFNILTLVGIAITIKFLKRWWLKQKETEQVASEKASAELQLLKAQIHPHFLFNSLNNIYSFALEGSAKAPEMIQKLSGLLHYMLRECVQPLVPLEKELNMIQDYIALEKIRYGQRLRIQTQIQPDNDHQMIAPLLLIPFVENSFKHGTSKMLSRPEISLNIIVLEHILHFKLTNSRPAQFDDKFHAGNRGLGLKNVMKRLSLLYPGRHELQIIDDPSTYTVWLRIALSEPVSSKLKLTAERKVSDYELA